MIMSSPWFLLTVIPDEAYDRMEKEMEFTFVGYHVPEWKDTFPHPVASKVGERLLDKLDESFGVIFMAPDFYYQQTKQSMSGVLFVGLFVSVIFVICAGSFIYFRLYADQERDRRHYQAASKLGLTEREMKKSATLPIALLFFIPFTMAVFHTAVALVAVQKILNICNPSSFRRCGPSVHFLSCSLSISCSSGTATWLTSDARWSDFKIRSTP